MPEEVVFALDAIRDLSNGNSIFTPEDLDDQITTNLPPCLDTLVNDLKTLQNGKFGQVITQFAGNNPVPLNYNWNITTGNLPPNKPASTAPSLALGGISVTTINQNDINVSTDLSWAKTLIHEAFHAYLVSVYRYRNIDKSYINLINTYASQFNNNLNDAQHHIFTKTNIINAISLALKEYGLYKGYNLSQQFYDDMAWGGLTGTQAFNGISVNDQNRIISLILAEYKNSSNNPLGTAPSGNQICP